MPKLIEVLEKETDLTLAWLKNNNMIANPEKFHCIILSRDNNEENVGVTINISDRKIKSESNVKLLGVHIDNKLNFDLHISKIVKSASAQLNAINILRKYLNSQAKSVLVQSFVLSNFNYCPLIWHFSSSRSLKKIESIQKRALRFLLDDDESSYKVLLSKSRKNSMNVNRLKILCTEIFKTINDLNPSYLKNIFNKSQHSRPVRIHNKNNLVKMPVNTVKYGEKV